MSFMLSAIKLIAIVLIVVVLSVAVQIDVLLYGIMPNVVLLRDAMPQSIAFCIVMLSVLCWQPLQIS